MARLKDLFILQMGKTPARANDKYWDNGTNSWISISDMSNYNKFVKETKEHITDLAVSECGIKCVPKNTVIMSFKLSLGKTAITTSPIYTNEAIMAFIPKDKTKILSSYLYYLLSGHDWNKGTNRAVMGATLNKATLGEIDISLAPFEQQKKIVERLDLLSDLIENQKKQLEKLDELVKSQFIEMFGDAISNSKMWVQYKLGEKADIGSSKRIFAREYVETGVPFYRSKEIIELGNQQKPSVELFISQERYQEIKDKFGVPKKGDILMTAVGTIGKFWTVDTDAPFYYKDGNLVYIRTNEFNKTFFRKMLETLIDDYKQEVANGSAYAALPIEKLKNMKIIVPPMELQNQYGQIVQQADKSKFEIKKTIEELETLKKSLMQEYFG